MISRSQPASTQWKTLEPGMFSISPLQPVIKIGRTKLYSALPRLLHGAPLSTNGSVRARKNAGENATETHKKN